MSSLGDWASLFPSGGKMAQGRCTILLQKDMSPVHAATVTIKRLRSVSGSRSSSEALRHVATEVPEPYPTSFLSKGSCERKDLQTWTPKPPRAKSRGHGVCEGGDSSECRRVLAEVRRRVKFCLARNGRHSDHLPQFPGRGVNGDDKRWIWISNDHGSILAPNDVCDVINTRAGSERNVSVFSETPCR